MKELEIIKRLNNFKIGNGVIDNAVNRNELFNQIKSKFDYILDDEFNGSSFYIIGGADVDIGLILLRGKIEKGNVSFEYIIKNAGEDNTDVWKEL